MAAAQGGAGLQLTVPMAIVQHLGAGPSRLHVAVVGQDPAPHRTTPGRHSVPHCTVPAGQPHAAMPVVALDVHV